MFDQFLIETTLDDQDISSMIPLEAIFDHIGNHNALLKNLLKSENGNLFFDRAHEYWIKQLHENLIKQNFIPNIPMEIFVENIVQSVITFIKWSLKNDCCSSAKEMTDFWKKANMI